jgi:hypothetical protein
MGGGATVFVCPPRAPLTARPPLSVSLSLVCVCAVGSAAVRKCAADLLAALEAAVAAHLARTGGGGGGGGGMGKVGGAGGAGSAKAAKKGRHKKAKGLGGGGGGGGGDPRAAATEAESSFGEVSSEPLADALAFEVLVFSAVVLAHP